MEEEDIAMCLCPSILVGKRVPPPLATVLVRPGVGVLLGQCVGPLDDLYSLGGDGSCGGGFGDSLRRQLQQSFVHRHLQGDTTEKA